ncbi:MAG TPA: PHP-associated domain-containing protein [Candidatus Gracilibacteria bacterium]|nr:PHP-associated domain-containing protein [Candidatus Gracilibacteria bacterium]
MAKLKVQLHLHTRQDPVDNIRHTEKEVIDNAARLGYDVLAITCHNVVIFNEDLKKYAEEKRILLIPAIEKSIRKKHVIILNADIHAQKIKTFEDLKEYRARRPDCVTIAAHPYYGCGISLGKKLDEHIDLFDAIEYSWFHSKKTRHLNAKAIRTAEKFRKPVIGTSDNHLLRYFDQTYSLLDAEKNISSVLDAIRKNRITIVSHPLPLIKMPFIIGEMEGRRLLKNILLK